MADGAASSSGSGSGSTRTRSRSRQSAVKNGVTVIYLSERESKNFMRFEEEVENGKDPIVGSYFYIGKKLFDKLGKPDAIEVQIKPTE
jgi:hypothetical protein